MTVLFASAARALVLLTSITRHARDVHDCVFYMKISKFPCIGMQLNRANRPLSARTRRGSVCQMSADVRCYHIRKKKCITQESLPTEADPGILDLIGEHPHDSIGQRQVVGIESIEASQDGVHRLQRWIDGDVKD